MIGNPERALVERLQGGDASAVTDLIAAYGAQVERVAFRYLKNREDAQVELRDLQGLSTAEASRVIGVTSQTLKSRLHRGRTILRPRLAAFRGGLSLHPGTSHSQARRAALAARGDGP